MGAIIQSLGDRLAEASAERLHWLVRSKLWEWIRMRWLMASDSSQRTTGYSSGPGYPACPTTVRKR